MIPREWAEIAEAPPGYVLVERNEMPMYNGHIILPDTHRKRTLSATATVLTGPRAGKTVILTSSAGRPVTFGVPGEMKKLVRVLPSHILAVLNDDATELKTEVGGYRSDAMPIATDPYPEAFDEGDPRGLR